MEMAHERERQTGRELKQSRAVNNVTSEVELNWSIDPTNHRCDELTMQNISSKKSWRNRSVIQSISGNFEVNLTFD